MNKFLILVLAILVVLPMVNAQTFGYFGQNTNLSLVQMCGNETSPCDYCNITSVRYPNSTVILENIVMTQDGTEFNYTLADNFTGVTGKYMVNGYCGAGTEIIVWAYDLDITPTGQEITSGQGFASIGLILSMILLAGFFSFFGFKLSESDKLFPIALFFMLLSMILSVYILHLGYIYSRDILFPIGTDTSQFRVYFGIMYGLIGMGLIGMVLLTVKTIREIKIRKSTADYGEDMNEKNQR